MRKFILPALLAVAIGFAYLPSQAKAGGVSVVVSPGVVVAPTYPYPVYSNYYYTPPVYYTPVTVRLRLQHLRPVLSPRLAWTWRGSMRGMTIDDHDGWGHHRH